MKKIIAVGIFLCGLLVVNGCGVPFVEKEDVKNELENCTSWFDGCNTCSVNNGKVEECTLKFCSEDQYEEPRCVKLK